MQHWLDQIHSYLRACAYCGRGTLFKSSPYNLYCDICWSNLIAKTDCRECLDYRFDIRSLFVWKKADTQIENLIYSLKRGKPASAFRELAELFILNASPKIEPGRLLLVVPPSSQKGRADHAMDWGKALAELLSCEIIAPFEFATGKSAEKGFIKSVFSRAVKPQKQKGLRDRFDRQFKLKDAIEIEGRKIVFVDDLITSGATALAAYRALNFPVEFEVWTIARRPKLAGITGI